MPKRQTRTKRKERKNVEHGVAHIRSTFNNTTITITDTTGNAIAWASSGMMGFKGTRKGTPFAAQLAAESAAKTAMEHGMKQVEAYVKGPGEAGKRPSGHCRQPAWTSAPSRTSLPFLITAAVRRRDGEYN